MSFDLKQCESPYCKSNYVNQTIEDPNRQNIIIFWKNYIKKEKTAFGRNFLFLAPFLPIKFTSHIDREQLLQNLRTPKKQLINYSRSPPDGDQPGGKKEQEQTLTTISSRSGVLSTPVHTYIVGIDGRCLFFQIGMHNVQQLNY